MLCRTLVLAATCYVPVHDINILCVGAAMSVGQNSNLREALLFSSLETRVNARQRQFIPLSWVRGRTGRTWCHSLVSHVNRPTIDFIKLPLWKQTLHMSSKLMLMCESDHTVPVISRFFLPTVRSPVKLLLQGCSCLSFTDSDVLILFVLDLHSQSLLLQLCKLSFL